MSRESRGDQRHILIATQEGIPAGQGIEPTPEQVPLWLQIPAADRAVGLEQPAAQATPNDFCVQDPAFVQVPSVHPFGPALTQTWCGSMALFMAARQCPAWPLLRLQVVQAAVHADSQQTPSAQK